MNVDEFIKDWMQKKFIYVNVPYKITHELLKRMLIDFHALCNVAEAKNSDNTSESHPINP